MDAAAKGKVEKAVFDLEWANQDVAIEYFDDGNHVTIWRYKDRLIVMVIDREGRMDRAMMDEVLKLANEYRQSLRDKADLF